jgi:uncharacterized protein YeaO (DUF488 family)
VTALRFHTAPMSYAGPDRLDITRKTGDDFGRLFAPSWGLLAPALEERKAGRFGEDDWARYVAAYTEEMRRSYRARRDAWDDLLARPRVVAVCYCRISETRPWCHRRVLADLLAQLGAVDLGEAVGWQDDAPPNQLGLFGGQP